MPTTDLMILHQITSRSRKPRNKRIYVSPEIFLPLNQENLRERERDDSSNDTIHFSGDQERPPASGRKLSLTTSHASSTRPSFVIDSGSTSVEAISPSSSRQRSEVGGGRSTSDGISTAAASKRESEAARENERAPATARRRIFWKHREIRLPGSSTCCLRLLIPRVQLME